LFYLDLIQNVALLVCLVVIHGQIIRRWNKRTISSQAFSGFLFGCVALAGMMTPVHLMPGLIFDGRSIVLSVAGFFGGPITAGIAAIMSGGYRLWTGGPGAVMGVSVILESAGLGVIFYYLRRHHRVLTRNLYLFGFGLLVHVGMLLLMLLLPREAMLKTLENITIPVLLIYPAATWLICLLFLDQEARLSAENAVRESEARYRAVFENAAMGIDALDRDGRITQVNPALSNMLGYTEDELRGRTFDEVTHPDDRQVSEQNLESLIKGEIDSYRLQKRYLRKNGEIVWGDVTTSLIKDANGNRNGVVAVIADTTERKQAETELRQSEEKFAKVFHFAPALITLSNVDDGTYLDVNDKFCEVSGFSRAESLGKTSVDLGWISPEDRIRLIEELQAHGSIRGMDLNLLTKDKRQIHCIYNGELIQTKDRQLLLSIALDITERKKIEETLRERERVWATLINNLPGFVYRCANDRDWTMEYISHGCLEVTGYAPDDFIGNNNLAYNDIVHPDYSEPLWEKWQKLLINKGVFEEEYPIIAKGGEARWVWERGRGIFSKDGQLLFLEGFISDITERKRSEETVQRSEKFLEQVLENIPNMIFVKEAENLRFVRFNRAGEDLLGYSRQALLGKNDYDFFPPAQAGFFTAKDRAVLTDGKLLDIPEEEIETKLKGKRILHTKKIPIIDADGTAQFLLGISEDITERKQFEESQKLLSTAIAQSAEAVIITDAKGIIQYVNPAQEILSGYSSDELIGQTPNVLNSDFHHGNFYEQIWDTIGVGKAWSGRFVNKKKDGTEYHEDATISPIYDHSRNLTNFVAVKHDVTKQVTLQEQLLQAQKMEAIGTLAGGFAHDFNNKLQVIAGYVDLILFDKDLPETLKQELGIIKQTVDSSAELVEGMMVFSRKTPVNVQAIELNKLVAQIRSMLIRTIPKMIEIDLLLADDLWAIKAAPNQIEQILMNLAVNARDAMPDGGKLTIETNNIVLDEEYCSFDPLVKPGRYVLIEVSDTGTGMNKETASHIFEPFFTTKKEGKGTGLGLAVVYGIVEQHGARIVCDSAPSVGTTFRIYFPAIEEVHEEEYFENKEPPRGQGETILLVDDEPNLVVIVSRQLLSANYRVIKASNGNEALNLYEKHREKIRLVILDLLMPGMGGKQCLEALRKLDPNVRVLVASGAMNSAIEADLKEIGARGLIAKPFETPQFLEKIRKIIDEE